MAYDQNSVHAFYKKLLTFYPRGFRERFGESMLQTFNDLCNEKQKTKSGLFSFVLWTVIETAIGILQEHIVLIKETNPMNSILTNLRLPAIIGFLIILPFIVLEITVVIIKRLTFDLRDALDSIVTFGFLWLGVAAILLILLPLVRNLRRARKDIAANSVPAQRNTLLTNPTSGAIIGLLLALPYVTLFSLLLFHIEPPFAALLKSPNPDQPNVIGTLIVLGVFLLAVAAGLIARAPIARTLQAGGSVFAHPINLFLAAVILFFLTMFVVGFMVDQFPCWIGVPNCD